MMSYFQSLHDDRSVPSQTGTDTSTLTQTQIDAANAMTQQQNIQLETLKLLKDICDSMPDCAPAAPVPAPSLDNCRPARKTPYNVSFPHSIINLYFWTQGGCNHLSKDCKRRGKGHQATATFANKMGGSTVYCT